MENFKIDNEYQLKFNPNTNYWDTYQYEQLLPKNAEKLFKYFPLNLYSIDGLLRSYFHLTNPEHFNDPFDCNLNLTNNWGKIKDSNTLKRNNLKNIGICSFSESIDNPLMWAHYTNNYNGFVLEFTGNKIAINLDENKIKRLSLTRVIYPENPVIISSDYPFAYHYLLTTKFKQWSYEKEWRIITELKTTDRELEYYPESIKGIYIGHKIPDENLSAYKMLLTIQGLIFPKTPVYVVYPDPNSLKLQFEKV